MEGVELTEQAQGSWDCKALWDCTGHTSVKSALPCRHQQAHFPIQGLAGVLSVLLGLSPEASLPPHAPVACLLPQRL